MISKTTGIGLTLRGMARSLRSALPATVMAVLLLSAPGAQADESTGDGVQWGPWTALGNGYVARRRQPAKFDQPKFERQLSRVQLRLQTLLQRKQDLMAKLNGSEGNAAAQIQKQVDKLEGQITEATQAQATQTRKQQKVNSAGNGAGASALWLRTGEKGLYEVSITELATALGTSDSTLRRQAQRGQLELTTGAQPDSEQADSPVSWHFDEASDSVIFAGSTYDTFYSSENAYKLVPGDNKSTLAAPMAVASGAAPAAPGSATPFRETLKFEEEPDFGYVTWAVPSEPDADYWWWDYLYGGYKDLISANLSIPDPASAGTAQLRVSLRGWTDLPQSNEHQVYAELNGMPVGTTVIWDGFQQAVLVADFDQSILDPSGDNTLTLHNSYAPGTHPGEWLDQVEIDYQRNPVARDGKLWMHNVAVGTQTVSGFSTSDIAVVEAPQGEATLREDVSVASDGLGGWSVTFDVQNEQTDFLVQEKSASAAPVVIADSGIDLRNGDSGGDYMIIAPRVFAGTAQALAAYRSNRYGSVKIAWLDDIYNGFSAGRTDPAALARFMRYVVSNSSTVPTDVALMGKGTLDEKDRMGYADSFLPVVMTSTPWALTASDSRLLGFEDDAPFTIGRLPITNDAEGIGYVNKLIAYESSLGGSERYEAVLVADNPDDGGDFHANSDLLADRLLDTLGFDKVTKLYHPDTNVRASLADSATWNTGYISYDGHGGATQVGNFSENFLTAARAALLSNPTKPVFTALTCAAGDDTRPGTRSLAGTLVLNPAGGAMASVAPTGASLDDPAQTLGNALVDSLFGSNNTVGRALKDAKTATSGSIAAFMPRMYIVVGEPGVYAR